MLATAFDHWAQCLSPTARRRRWALLRRRATRSLLLAVLSVTTGLGAAPSPLGAQSPIDSAQTIAPHLVGWVDLGPVLVGAEVRLVGTDGTKIAGPAPTDDGGFYFLDIDEVPAGARVQATGGTYGAAPFHGTLSALVERYADGTDRPTWVTVATTLQVERLDAAPGTAPADAEAEVATLLGFSSGQISLGMDVALADEIVPQDELVRVAEANGGFDRFVDRLVRREAAALELVPRARFAPPATGAVAEAAAIASGGIADLVGKFLLTKAKDLLLRKAGFAQPPNQLTEISNQLRELQVQLLELSIRIERLAEQIQANALLAEISRYRIAYVHGVREGWSELAEVTIKAADLQAARLEGKGAELRAEAALAAALSSFDDACSKGKFAEAPGAFTDQFKSPTSMLQGYTDVFMRPRRYLMTADSLAFSDFFYSYHLIQIQALRLHAECLVRKDPDSEEAVFNLVFGQHPTSHYNRAQLKQLPSVMPQPIPGTELVFPAPSDQVVLDVETGLLWWNGTYVGLHRDQIVVLPKPDHDIPLQATAGVPPGPNGPWAFELAGAAEISKMIDLLGAPMPLARSRGTAGSRYPNRLAPFLEEIGLGRVAAHASDFVWAREKLVPIRHCHEATNYGDGVVCKRYYSEDFGYTGVAIHYDGRKVSVPLICGAGGCDADGVPRSRQLMLCPTMEGPFLPDCLRKERFADHRGPGLYRAKPLENDRFATIDLTVLP